MPSIIVRIEWDVPADDPDWLNPCSLELVLDNYCTNTRFNVTAVPELLEACKVFVEAWDKCHQLEKTDMALQKARVAIAKAQPDADLDR